MMYSPSVEPSPSRTPGIQSFLRSHHAANARRPIGVPNEFGAFPDSHIPAVPPFVVDANELFRDVSYAARTDKRTVLVSLANSGYIRLFCAQHVLDEILEHAERMAKRLKAPLSAFMDHWDMEYVPLLRRIEVSESLITEEEARRMDTLKETDPDDIPSVT